MTRIVASLVRIERPAWVVVVALVAVAFGAGVASAAGGTFRVVAILAVAAIAAGAFVYLLRRR